MPVSVDSAHNMRSMQLPLAIGLSDTATFENFLPAGNAPVCHVLQQASEPFVYLWGPAGCGKSHLLQAACHAEDARGGRAVYLPLPELLGHSPVLLEGMEQMTLVCVDDLQCIAQAPAWQHALFHLYNRLRDAGHHLLAAGDAAPHALALSLADLVSRLCWGPVFRLLELTDNEKSMALQQRAQRRGMSMPDEIATYLLAHGPRDMHQLFGLLEQLDQRSLIEQRRLTIPFVRQLLGPARP